MRRKLSLCKDDWYFDFGYNIAFTQIIYVAVIIYAPISPLITIFGCLFFFIKYFIDKYNITHIYPQEFYGEGRLYKSITKYQYTSMIISEIVMFGKLSKVFGDKSLNLVYIIILIQLFVVFVK